MSETDNSQSLKETIIQRLTHSKAHFKHQQRGEPDLSNEQKREIIIDIIERNISLFLSRFGKFLEKEDLLYFASSNNNYEVEFQLKELNYFLTHKENIIKNRRYEAMKQLTASGDYFTEEEMKHREPFLYDEMVGQFLTEEPPVNKSDLRLSTILLKHIEMKQDRIVCSIQKEIQESQTEEFDSSSDEDDRSMNEIKCNSIEDQSQENVPPVEMAKLREDFLRSVQERFLSGQDAMFDYSTVDYNSDYDPVQQNDRDIQDRYFTESDEET